jgi:hypothetical protein
MPNFNGSPNRGPIDLLYLLNRRRVSFKTFCENNNIKTQSEFQALKTQIQNDGDFFVSSEMDSLAKMLPEALRSELETRIPTLPPPPLETALQAQEEASTRRKNKKAVTSSSNE